MQRQARPLPQMKMPARSNDLAGIYVIESRGNEEFNGPTRARQPLSRASLTTSAAVISRRGFLRDAAPCRLPVRGRRVFFPVSLRDLGGVGFRSALNRSMV